MGKEDIGRTTGEISRKKIEGSPIGISGENGRESRLDQVGPAGCQICTICTDAAG